MNVNTILNAVTIGVIGVVFAWLKGRLSHQDRKTEQVHRLVNSRLQGVLLELAQVKLRLYQLTEDYDGIAEAKREIARLEARPSG